MSLEKEKKLRKKRTQMGTENERPDWSDFDGVYAPEWVNEQNSSAYS